MPANSTSGPRVTVLRAVDRADEPWRNGGGSTRQIAAQNGPDGWEWRLSMARVEADGPFSVFPGVTRTIMVMDGEGMTLNVAGSDVALGSEPVTFDGEALTHGTLRGSAVTDFNVMVRRGQYSASTARIAAGHSAFTVPAELPASPCTVILVAPVFGAQLKIKQLGLDLDLSGYDAVMIDGVMAPLLCSVTSPDSGVRVVLMPEQDELVLPRRNGRVGGTTYGGDMTATTPQPAVRQLRLVVEAEDFDAAVAFYRDALGLTEQAAFQGEGGAKVMILNAGLATLELSNPAQVKLIDQVEADGQPSAKIRIAFEVDDSQQTTDELVAAGGELVASPRETPWRSLNSRLNAPAGLQVTLFQELESLDARSARPGFTEPPQPE